MPLGLSNAQLPPMRSDASNQSNASPASLSRLAVVKPEQPAPIRAIVMAGL